MIARGRGWTWRESVTLIRIHSRIIPFPALYLSVPIKGVIYLLFNLLTTLAKLLRPGGGRAVIAENLLLKQQLIIHSSLKCEFTRYRYCYLYNQRRTSDV